MKSLFPPSLSALSINSNPVNVQSAVDPLYKKQYKLPIETQNANLFADQLYSLQDKYKGKGADIAFSPSTNYIEISGPNSADAEQDFKQMVVSGTCIGELKFSLENYAMALYYRDIMNGKYIIANGIIEVRIRRKANVGEILKSSLPLIGHAVFNFATSMQGSYTEVFSKITKNHTEYYYYNYKGTLYLMENDKLAVISKATNDLQEKFDSLLAYLNQTKSVIYKKNREEIKEDQIKHNVTTISIEKVQPNNNFYKEDINIDDKLNYSEEIKEIGEQSARIELSEDCINKVINQSNLQPSFLSETQELIKEVSKPNEKLNYDDPDIVYETPSDSEVRHYCAISKTYLKIEFRKKSIKCKISLLHKFDWEDMLGTVKQLTEQDRTVLNLELDKTYLIKQKLNKFERKIGNFILRPLISFNKLKTKSIDVYKNGTRINSFIRKKVPNVAISNMIPYIFAINLEIGLAINHISKLYQVKKIVKRDFYVNKYVPIMEDEALKRRIYEQYMVKVLDLVKRDNCMILMGIRPFPAFNEICLAYECRQISEDEYYNSSSVPKQVEKKNEHSKPEIKSMPNYEFESDLHSNSLHNPMPANLFGNNKPNINDRLNSINVPDIHFKQENSQVSLPSSKNLQQSRSSADPDKSKDICNLKNKQAKEEKTLSTQSIVYDTPQSRSQNLSKAKEWALDIVVYNENNWKDGYSIKIGSNSYLCFPLKMPVTSIKMQGRITIKVNSVKDVLSIKDCIEFPAAYEAVMDAKHIAIQDPSNVDLEIMFRV